MWRLLGSWFLALQVHHEVLDTLLIDLSDSFFVKVDWYQFAFNHFRVLQEHVQEHFDLLSTTAHKVTLKFAEPFFLRELRKTCVVLKAIFDRGLPCLDATVSIFDMEGDVVGLNGNFDQKLSVVLVNHIKFDHIECVGVICHFI